jgi:hypothetical protein
LGVRVGECVRGWTGDLRGPAGGARRENANLTEAATASARTIALLREHVPSQLRIVDALPEKLRLPRGSAA